MTNQEKILHSYYTTAVKTLEHEALIVQQPEWNARAVLEKEEPNDTSAQKVANACTHALRARSAHKLSTHAQHTRSPHAELTQPLMTCHRLSCTNASWTPPLRLNAQTVIGGGQKSGFACRPVMTPRPPHAARSARSRRTLSRTTTTTTRRRHHDQRSATASLRRMDFLCTVARRMRRCTTTRSSERRRSQRSCWSRGSGHS